ncbi:MAG: LamG domain-containing protein, partial [Verrucomicrobiota bacterium]
VASLGELTEKYVEALEGMKSSYTKSGEIEIALAVSAEIEMHKSAGKAIAKPVLVTIESLPKLLQTGLMIWFPLNEKEGGTVSGMGREDWLGTLIGTTYSPEGAMGGARRFNGIADRINLGKGIPDSDRFTVSVWVKTDAKQTKGGIFSDYDGKGGNDVMLALVGNQSVHIRADKSGDTLRAILPISRALTSNWHHLVWVMDGRDSIIYLDGEEVGRHEEEGSNKGFHGAYLGYANDLQSWSYFEGELDEFMMWNRPLDEEEIRNLISLY